MRRYDFRLPTIVGHRGVTETGPENTLIALERAATEGATWVEFDVQLSADQQPLLFHDSSLARTTKAEGYLVDQEAAALLSLDASSWFTATATDSNQHGCIPHLNEALDLCHYLGLGMNIEIKPGRGDHRATTAAALAALRHMAWQDWDQVLISSFEHDSLVQAYEEAPWIARGYLLHEIPANWLRLMQSIEATTLHSHYKTFSRHQQQAAQSLDYPIMLYSVDDCQSALRLMDRGIEALCTGTPALISQAIKKAGFPLQF